VCPDCYYLGPQVCILTYYTMSRVVSLVYEPITVVVPDILQ